ncbi:MAG: helix-turn-helix transcriptional regulator [Arcobacter sp.]|uniref:S24 family peptidase n=1 Tax=Arcobacter sp. TaxID=1872629 RepID=UPI003D01BF77
MNNIINIIEKIKDILSKELGNKKVLDKDIATALEINYDNFRKQKARNKIPYFEIMSFLAKRNISINWFFFNQLPESLIENTSNYIILKYQKNIIGSAGGGAINYEIDPEPLIIDKQLLNYINSNYKYTEILQVFGESMEPNIKDGSLIFVDKSKKIIKNNNIYVIKVKNEIFIKIIKLKNDKVIFQSLNNIYNDLIFEQSEIEIVGKVSGLITKL